MQILSMDQRADLLRQLQRKTESGSLTWTNDGEYKFFTVLPRFSIAIINEDGDDVFPFILRVVATQTGAVVDNYWTDTPDSNLEQEVNDLLRELYQSVKGKALGLEDAVSDLFEDLSNVSEEPF